MPIPICGFLESTLIDWEGVIASEVFLPTCNFRCPYCHSAYLVNSPPNAETIPFDVVKDYVKENQGWIDGVIFSGGEPTLHAGLAEAMASVSSLGVKIKLDTNGSRPDVLESLLDAGLIDYIAMDIKAPFGKYETVAGRPLDVGAIRESIQLIIARAPAYEFRTTVCPAFLDVNDIEEIVDSITGVAYYVLQQFRPVDCLDPAMKSVRPYPQEKLEEIAERVRPKVRKCAIRNV